MAIRQSGPGDAYASVARHLAAAERMEEWALARIRRDVVRLLAQRGLPRVLDLACGTGPFSRRAADAGLAPVALDLSPTMLALAARKGEREPRFPVVLADAGRLPFRAEFDAVVLSLALHEMAPRLRERVWSEMRRVLRPGGCLVLIDFTAPPGARGPMARCARAFIAFLERQMARVHPPHYEGYLSYMAQGALGGWLRAHGVSPLVERGYFWGSIGYAVVCPGSGAAVRPDDASLTP